MTKIYLEVNLDDLFDLNEILFIIQCDGYECDVISSLKNQIKEYTKKYLNQ